MSVVTATIINRAEGQLSPEFQVLSVDICKEVNRIPRAEIVVADGSIARQQFELANKTFFQTGEQIEIKLRYEDRPQEEATLFVGMVVGQAVASQGTRSQLKVSLKDIAVRMTINRRSRVHRELSDADIISNLAAEHSLSAGAVDATEPVHEELLQYYSTDWDFLMLRAQAQGLLVKVDDGGLSARRDLFQGRAGHRFEYGLHPILAFTLELDASRQPRALQSLAWDTANQALTAPVDAAEPRLPQGRSSAAEIAEVVSNNSAVLINPVPLPQPELQAWADASTARIRMAMRRGSLSVPGVGNIKPFDLIELAGISDQFNGTVLVSAVRHRITAAGGWITDIQFGLPEENFAVKPGIADYPAAGMLPPVNGLRIGVVADFEADPAAEFRLKVILPGVGADGDTLWARMASGDAGNNRGLFFRPEVGDEVVVGFFNNDPRQAVVLGSLYSSAQPPLEDWKSLSADNVFKGIATRTGTRIEFADEETGKLLIQTARERKVLLDDSSETIEVSDPHGNTIVMDSKGISIISDADIILQASGKVEIGGRQVDIK